MTMKCEEVRAQERARKFLEGLAFGDIKRIPPDVRKQAKYILRHLATPMTVERGSINGCFPRDAGTRAS
jgi:hypothetical protein